MTSSDRIEELLEELVNWTKFANRQALIDVLTDLLVDPKHLAVYEASDGQATQNQVASTSGVAQGTVSNLWAKWRRIGVVGDVDGRARHLAKPSDLGLL